MRSTLSSTRNYENRRDRSHKSEYMDCQHLLDWYIGKTLPLGPILGFLGSLGGFLGPLSGFLGPFLVREATRNLACLTRSASLRRRPLDKSGSTTSWSKICTTCGVFAGSIATRRS